MSACNRRFALTVLPGFFAILRLATDAAIPTWAMAGDWFSLTRTRDELSIVCLAAQVPSGLAKKSAWRALKVQGPFALSEIGVLASLAAALADAKVSLFAISTFDTDYLLVSEDQLDVAVAALQAAGHTVFDGNAVR